MSLMSLTPVLLFNVAPRRFLPKDINPKVKEQLDALLGDAPAGKG
jgi:hypothetical protein